MQVASHSSLEPSPSEPRPRRKPFRDSQYGLGLHVEFFHLQNETANRNAYRLMGGGGIWGEHSLAKNPRWQWRWNLELSGGRPPELRGFKIATTVSSGAHYALKGSWYVGLGVRTGFYTTVNSERLGLGGLLQPFLELSWRGLGLSAFVGGQSFPEQAFLAGGMFRVRFGHREPRARQSLARPAPGHLAQGGVFLRSPGHNNDAAQEDHRLKRMRRELAQHPLPRTMYLTTMPAKSEKDYENPWQRSETALCGFSTRDLGRVRLQTLGPRTVELPLPLEDCPVLRIPKSAEEREAPSFQVKKIEALEIQDWLRAGNEAVWADAGEEWWVLFPKVRFADSGTAPQTVSEALDLSRLGAKRYEALLQRQVKFPQFQLSDASGTRKFLFYLDAPLDVDWRTQAKEIVRGIEEAEALLGAQFVERIYFPNTYRANAGVDPRDLNRINIYDEALKKWSLPKLRVATSHEVVHLFDLHYGISQDPDFFAWFEDSRKRHPEMLDWVNEGNFSGEGDPEAGHARDNEYEFCASLINDLNLDAVVLESKLRDLTESRRNWYAASLGRLEQAVRRRAPGATLLLRRLGALREQVLGMHHL